MYRLRALALVSTLALVAPAAVHAQPQWGPSGNHPAYSEGYQRGERAGTDDSRRRDAFQFADESDYRRGDIGYRSQYGSRDRYRDVFRQGFEAGYRNGYARYSYGGPGRPGVPPWANGGRAVGRYDAATQVGQNDGYEAGLNDARNNRRFDPISEGRYRSADRGYEREYGSKDVYKTHYREAFRQGYERGYQDARRYNGRPRGIFGRWF